MKKFIQVPLLVLRVLVLLLVVGVAWVASGIQGLVAGDQDAGEDDELFKYKTARADVAGSDCACAGSECGTDCSSSGCSGDGY